METPTTAGLNGIAGLIEKKWFAAMGLVGLLILTSSLLIEVPHDPILVGGIGATLLGFGFCQADCRTTRTTIGYQFGRLIEVTGPVWRWTFTGALMAMVGLAGVCTVAYRLIW